MQIKSGSIATPLHKIISGDAGVCWLLLCGLLIFMSQAVADEISPYKRISLKESEFSRQDKTRVMLYSSEFSLFPQLYAGATYIPNQQSPGVSGGEAVLAQLIATLFIKGVNNKKTEEATIFKAKIEEALKGLDIKQEFQNALIKELKAKSPFESLEFEHATRIHDLAQPGLLIRIEEKNIFTVSTNVSFDSNLSAIYLTASSKLWLKNKSTPIYYSDFSYLSGSIKESSLSDLRNRWTENDGELLKSKIIEGIAEIAYMLVSDLQRNKIEDIQYLADMELTSPYTGKKTKTKFYPLEEKSERLIGRPDSLDSSLIISTPKQ